MTRGGDASEGWLCNVGLPSPDNTSEGALPKRWVCRQGDRLLLKGQANWTDQQPYNEAVATLLCQLILQPGEYVPYWVEPVRPHEEDVSVCRCFLNRDEEFFSAAALLNSEGQHRGEPIYDALVRHAKNLGIPQKQVEKAFSQMIVCDALLANNDRHLRNFGFIRNIHTLEYRMAPLFDFGNSLWFDHDESAVARGDYSYTVRPFEGSLPRQLYLAGSMDWLDAAKLEEFVPAALEILEQGILARWRLEYLEQGMRQQIAVVLAMKE